MHVLADTLLQLFGLAPFPEAATILRPRYNIAPTQDAGVITSNGRNTRQLSSLSWGLLPEWQAHSSSGKLLINARSETMHEKPSFSTSYQQFRAIVPATGYYEWQQVGRGKQPFHFHADGQVLALAALWRPTDSEQGQFCLVTQAARDGMAGVHHRMPLMVARNNWDQWLFGNRNDADEIVMQGHVEPLQITPISRRVNSATYDAADVLTPVDPDSIHKNGEDDPSSPHQPTLF